MNILTINIKKKTYELVWIAINKDHYVKEGAKQFRHYGTYLNIG